MNFRSSDFDNNAVGSSHRLCALDLRTKTERSFVPTTHNILLVVKRIKTLELNRGSWSTHNQEPEEASWFGQRTKNPTPFILVWRCACLLEAFSSITTSE